MTTRTTSERNRDDKLPDSKPHRYIPNAGEDVREMLAVIGVDSIDRLFESIPKDVQLDTPLDIPGPWSEIETRRYFRGLAAKNKTAADHVSFLGGGAHAHTQPASADRHRPAASARTRRIPDLVHPVSAGGLAGDAAV